MFLKPPIYIETFKQLFMKSVKITTPGLFDKIINGLIWTSLNIIIFAFIMPSMGVNQNFGIFIAATMPASSAFFSSINCIYQLLSDVTNEGSNLQYELTLPIPQWFIFAKYAFENAYQSFCNAFLLLPLGSLILWKDFPFKNAAFAKFYFLLFITSLFSGFFAVFITSITKDAFNGLDNVWVRIIFPMWFLGGFQFSWKTLYSISPTLAYINLLNPLTYALEGSRACILEPNLSLSFELCTIALILFTVLFGYIGIQNLKNRLDCL